MSAEEMFEVVTETGERVGLAPRSECHSNPKLIHRAVHILVRNSEGRLFLQKRARNKDIQPGKWDTSVGGHVQPGESTPQAALREIREELGASGTPALAYEYLWRTERETELVTTFTMNHDGPFTLQAEEIDAGRFWTFEDIEDALGTGVFTPNFEVEFQKLRALRSD
jgi:isopentenyldiphosphate isomerase